MLQKGMALRFNEEYYAEAEYAKKLNFSFFQIWFFNGCLSINKLDEPKEKKVKENGFPIILHALFDINDFEKYDDKLLELLSFFNHKEVIIHPVCTSEKVSSRTVFVLAEKINHIHKRLQERQIKLFVENNSVMDGFFNTVDELRVVFDNNPNIGLLLDLAHINDYDHLNEIVKMRYPECIHIADKRFGIPHEHIALGEGDLDFTMIFEKIIPQYSGKIILEAVDTKEDVEKSKIIIDSLFE